MTYAIFDSTASLVDSFDDEAEARARLESIVHQDPDSADEYALFTFDEAGQPVGEAVSGDQFAGHIA